MNTQPFNSLRFDFINLVIFLAISTCCYCHENQQYRNCRQAYSCGKLTTDLKYPFWGGGRPEFCGRRGFELKCQQDQNSIIEIENTQFLVLGINAEDHLMNVTSLDMLFNGYCGIDLNHLRNVTLSGGSEFFTFSRAMIKLSIFYGCTDATTRAFPNNFTCDYMGSQENGFYVDESFLWNRLQNITNLTTTSCKTSVDVPVLRSSLQNLSGLQDVLNAGFELAYDGMTNCYICEESGGLCGSDPTTRNFVCHCHDRTYPRTCQVDVLVVTIAPAVLVIIFIYLIRRRGMSLIGMLGLWKKERMDDQNDKEFMRHYGSLAPTQYRYSDIAKMTNSFKDKIGQGGYGTVYKGKLNDGRLVAVKVLRQTKGNGEEFINEVASISRTSHVNVVALLGFCFERKRRALVYEFMANGSLDKFIHNDESQSTNCHLEWRTMYQIAVGIAQGLEYLHRGCSTRIVHFDIKPHNILLDEDFCPKISDFGLAKLCQRKQSIMSMLGTRGTIGYIAPELFSRIFGGVSHKSDVYSYGMLVLEMSGASQKIEVDQTSEIYFPHWIYEYLEHGKDLKLQRITSAEDEETARKMILVGLWCIQTNPSDRPTMSKVLEMLEGSIQSLQIPPKPFLYSPARSAPSSQDSSMSSPTTNHVVEVPEGRLQSMPIPSKPLSFAPSRPHQTS